MTLLGITGGIGSGKSLVSSILRLKGIPVYDADSESKRLISTNETLKRQLAALLGSDIYNTEGLNKKRMAELIFNDKELLKQTNAIIHPAVANDFQAWASKQNANIVAAESAILFESKMNERIDLTIMVYAPLETRINRAIKRDQCTRDNVLARIQNQMDDEQKRTLADITIINDDKCALLPQIEELLVRLTNK